MKITFTDNEKLALKLAYEFMYDEYKRLYRQRKKDAVALDWIIKRLTQAQTALAKIFKPEIIDFRGLKRWTRN